ncbi:MAG: MFS transporter [Bacteroidia bacterium]|nr:MFS transporter [Bacteroidia bacterium]
MEKLALKEKIGYALGDTAANIAWRSLTTFLLVFYTDVFGISAAAAGVLLLVARISDGGLDIVVGMLADRTNTKHGKFRPWILWSAVPLGVLMALTFTTPNFSYTGKLIYAYFTYILMLFVYTSNNIPYSALMGVMTSSHKERTSLSSFRFAGAYLGGIITQGFLIYLVMFLGNGNKNLGYQYSMYLFAALLVGFLLITYFTTKERVLPSKDQQTNVGKDLKDLLTNRPWLILLLIGFLFVTYNSIKQGITVIYFERYLNNVSLTAYYMVALLVISVIAALVTTSLANFFGKRNLFIYVIVFSGLTNGMLYFFGPSDITAIFIFGILSEFGAGIMPVLFFAMLGDSADYSEWKNNRRATGLFYSAGTFAMKFGGGVAGAIIGFVLSAYHYNGMDTSTIPGAIPGIKLLMSWVPGIFAAIGASVLILYPLTKKKMDQIEIDLKARKAIIL